jgi:hypothetical protein
MRLRHLVLALALLIPPLAFAQGGQFTLIQSSTEPLPNCTPASQGQLQPQIWDVTAQQMKTCTAPNTWSQMGGGSGGGPGSGTQYAVADWATSSTLGSIYSTLFGQILQAQNGAAPLFSVQGLPLGNGGIPVTCGTPYTVLADTSTSILDRGTVLIFNSSSACAVTLPDPSTSGMGGNFPIKMSNIGAGTVTVTRATAATFTIVNGATATASATSFTLTTGQYITLHSDNTNWWGEEVSGAGGGGGGTPCTTTASSLQYDNAGAFGCVPDFTFNGTHTITLGASGSFVITGTISGVGLVAYFASPPGIGTTAPGIGAFTTLTATMSVGVGASPPNCGSATAIWCAAEASTAGTPTSGQDYIRADSTAHAFLSSLNGGSEFAIPQLICAGTITLPSGTAIGNGTKYGASSSTPLTKTCTGLITSDNIQLDFNADPTSTTGYTPGASLSVVKYPTSNTINVYLVNNTASSITPSSAVVNYHVWR